MDKPELKILYMSSCLITYKMFGVPKNIFNGFQVIEQNRQRLRSVPAALFQNVSMFSTTHCFGPSNGSTQTYSFLLNYQRGTMT